MLYTVYCILFYRTHLLFSCCISQLHPRIMLCKKISKKSKFLWFIRPNIYFLFQFLSLSVLASGQLHICISPFGNKDYLRHDLLLSEEGRTREMKKHIMILKFLAQSWHTVMSAHVLLGKASHMMKSTSVRWEKYNPPRVIRGKQGEGRMNHQQIIQSANLPTHF